MVAELEGAGTVPEPYAEFADASEFAAVWNASTPERRESAVTAIRLAAERSSRCFAANHDALPDPGVMYHDGFEEGVTAGYDLAGGVALSRVLAVRGDVAKLLETYTADRWTHEGVDKWARIAHDLLDTVRAAVSGEDVDALADASVLADVVAERARQDLKWGPPTDHADGTGPDARPLASGDMLSDRASASWLARWFQDQTENRFHLGRGTWADILLEEVFEAMAESDSAKLRAELVQVAAVSVKWARMIDARAVVAQEAARVTRVDEANRRTVERLDRAYGVPVHSHGTEDGPGLACGESRQADGSLRGACLEPVAARPCRLPQSAPPCIGCAYDCEWSADGTG